MNQKATELEQVKAALIHTRRAMFAAQKLAIALAEKDNEEEAAALEQSINARLDAEAQVRSATTTGNAEVVELRADGPVAA